MKDFIRLVLMVIGVLLALLLFRQCEKIDRTLAPTALPVPARTITHRPTPLPTNTPRPTLTLPPYSYTLTPKPTRTPTPFECPSGSAILRGRVVHVKPGTQYTEGFPGVSVVIYIRDNKCKIVRTDEAGVFKFEGLKSMKYNIRVFGSTFRPFNGPQNLPVSEKVPENVLPGDIMIDQEFENDIISLFFRKSVTDKEALALIRSYKCRFKRQDPESGAFVIQLPKGAFAPDIAEEFKRKSEVADAVLNYYISYKE